MKKLLMMMLLGAVAVPALAQDLTAPQEVTVRGYQIDLPVKTYRLFAEEFGQYKGGYDLSNGQSMVMAQTGRRMYAKVGEGQFHELVAASPGVFVARDRTLKITLQHDKFGAVTGELLMVPPNASMAANTPLISMRMVAAR
ncbi:hypothetical protein KY495_10780 [Massilia sp. PAMC28688]|uniref:hypothetical protein n=1 Tax=Massilia sp. PAMC28688 TaxID=2861283 RepID=UPI001C632B59|nr:hypothetical protein [Massilia sp. PAMC28688]QYF95585.1 hypothetical protein KY495_10780 [Massilia sp. PAMC28688]